MNYLYIGGQTPVDGLFYMPNRHVQSVQLLNGYRTVKTMKSSFLQFLKSSHSSGFRSFSAILSTLSLSALLLVGASVSFAADEVIDELKKIMAERMPDIDVTELSESPVTGVYELISDGQIYYISADGKYIFDGDLIDMEKRVNLTTNKKGSVHLAMINKVNEKEMLIYEPEEKSERSITVFTDISCGYCRKLHTELEQLLDGGVRVRYLMFPRAGLESQAHMDLESVWCADDPQAAMTNAKMGGKITQASCENPIEQHVALANQVGLRGTPLIYLDNGEMVPGYRSAKELVDMINNSKPL